MPSDFGPLPFIDVHGVEPTGGTPTLLLEYHQAAFLLLNERLAGQIEHALVTAPVSMRALHVTARLPIQQEITAERAWPVMRELLDIFEAEMAKLLCKHSVFFWIHIYRRIGVSLYPRHEDKTDPRTVMLVRQIVELALAKHGRATNGDELVPSNRVNPDLVLGGLMRAGIKALFKSRFTKTYRGVVKSLRESPQWVIRSFTEQDFLAIYQVEGLAYQYWRVTALMRALGKGARITVRQDGDWEYVLDDELFWLIRSVDERTEKKGLAGSLLGVWFDDDVRPRESGKFAASEYLICPVYNAEKVPLADLFQAPGLRVAETGARNFRPAFFNARRYLEAHAFLADAFRARHGYGLEAFVATLWAIANVVFFPLSFNLAKTEGSRRKIFRDTLMYVLQRGYRVLGADANIAVPVLLQRIKEFLPGVEIPEEEVQAVLVRLTLTPVSQGRISLWSGGPRYVLVPAGPTKAADLQGVPAMLATLFVRVAHDQGQRGTLFEEAFRHALERRGFEVQSGRLSAISGAFKELDAGVIVGRELFAFECVSVERPLDYEIGYPNTLARRRERLNGKVEQVLELFKFLKVNPRGTNYDYTTIQHIVPLVVSPFVEWLWDRSARLWISDSTPRILSADEALDLIERARGSGTG
jgi:hypothetical protein